MASVQVSIFKTADFTVHKTAQRTWKLNLVAISFIIKPTRRTNFTNLFAVPSWSCSKAVNKPVWYIPFLSVQWMNSWWWTKELFETCRVSCQNKFVKLVHLVGLIMKEICYDARAHERKFPVGHLGGEVTPVLKFEICFHWLRFNATQPERQLFLFYLQHTSY